MIVVVSVLAFAVSWVASRAWIAKGELEVAQRSVSSLAAGGLSSDLGALTGEVDEIRVHTLRARVMTDDPVWALTERLPVVGRSLVVMRQLTEAIDDVIASTQPLAEVAGILEPTALVPADGRIPLEPLEQAGVAIATAADEFAVHAGTVAAIDTSGSLGQLVAAQVTLEDLVGRASGLLAEASPLIDIVPVLLGADGPRTYVVMFVNNAELRSLGGTVLSFAGIAVDDGAITLTGVVPAGGGNFPWRTEPIVPVPAGFEEMWPDAWGTFVANATSRPSPHEAAEIVALEWEEKFGVQPDGVIALDGGALAWLLTAVGPVTLSTGDVVDSTTVVPLLFNQVYQRYNTGDLVADDIAQGAVYSETVAQVFSRLASGQFDPPTLFTSASAAASERRLTVWLADPEEEAAIATTAFSAKDLIASTELQDSVGVYLNDAVGSKLNYYLATTMTTASGVCTPDGRAVHRLILTMTNLLPPESVDGLSPSITGVLYSQLGLPRGMQRLIVLVYPPPGTTYLAMAGQDTMVDQTSYDDSGLPVRRANVHLMPGQTIDLTVDLLVAEPGQRTLRTDVTPTVNGTLMQTQPLDCASVALP